ncbi:MAG: hypothetical protein PHH54_06065 [Candidatus Nanoarchaeia archaeon]|nr:hypothetical protein [Candidatus Nanoarchaeia archaeon]MDD5741520.1 hypothetical protein [Candidatus Nanoarchaeia archaeon]
MDSQELIERYMVLLLGVKEVAMPSALHLQKEMFLLSNFKENLKEELNFKKHYYGPFSQVVEESVKSPTYLSDIFEFSEDKLMLSKKGKEEFDKMIQENRGTEEFELIISGLSLIRSLYDRLNNEELLFLIYCTYPEYTEFSSVSDNLLKDNLNKNKILTSLLNKGLITSERYEELKNG